MTLRNRTAGRVEATTAVSLIALVLAGMLLSGCVVAKAPSPAAWRVGESDRRAIRDVAVAPASFAVQPKLDLPAKGAGEGAGRGAALGALAPPVALGYAGGGYGVVLGILLSPFTAVIGAGVGAQSALPAETVEVDERTARAAFAAIHLNGQLASAVAERVTAETGHRVVATIAGPSNAKDTPNYREDIAADTIIEVRVTYAGLDGPWSINPPIKFVLRARARLIRLPGIRLLWDRPLSYEGPEMTLAEWSRDDGSKLREQIELAIAAVAERLVDELFLVYVPPSMARSKQ